jgi:ribosomal protein S18 acetylase RimI-like enzyme
MNILLRNLKTGDLDLLAEMLARIAVFDRSDCSIALELLTIARDHPEQQEYHCLVAAGPGDAPLGYACFGPAPLTVGTFCLYWIAVDPACAGQGIGSRLLVAIEEKVCQARGRILFLETSSRPSYAPTRQFYVKNGYILEETIRDFYREGEDRVTYLKRFD